MSSANSRRSIWETPICKASFQATRRMLQSFEGCWVKIKEQRHKLAGTLLESNVPFFFSCRWDCNQSKLRLNNGCSEVPICGRVFLLSKTKARSNIKRGAAVRAELLTSHHRLSTSRMRTSLRSLINYRRRDINRRRIPSRRISACRMKCWLQRQSMLSPEEEEQRDESQQTHDTDADIEQDATRLAARTGIRSNGADALF